MRAPVPPVGWADVATRSDVHVLALELRAEIKAGHAKLLRTLFFRMVATNATLVGLAFAAAKLV